jgi:hypothetical protein
VDCKSGKIGLDHIKMFLIKGNGGTPEAGGDTVSKIQRGKKRCFLNINIFELHFVNINEPLGILKNERDKSWFCLIHETSSISDS